MANVKLKFPVEHGGKTIEELSFRRARFGDFCAADRVEGENNKTAAVLAGMSGTSIPVIQGLDMEDMAAVLEAASPLMGNGQASAASQPA